MVQFNGSVKVLGYYLSDEERALKRQWSAENHERVMEVKKQIRQNKMQQYRKKRSTAALLTQPLDNPPNNSSSSSENVIMNPVNNKYLSQPKQLVSIQLQNMSSHNNNSSNNNYSKELYLYSNEQARKPHEAMSRNQPTFLEKSIEDATECKVECEHMTGKLAKYVCNVSKVVLEHMHVVASSAVDKEDMSTFNVLRNLIIPQLH